MKVHFLKRTVLKVDGLFEIDRINGRSKSRVFLVGMHKVGNNKKLESYKLESLKLGSLHSKLEINDQSWKFSI